jgi:hypothetical protein
MQKPTNLNQAAGATFSGGANKLIFCTALTNHEITLP